MCSAPSEDNAERVIALPPVFDEARHGPVSKANLQDLIDMLQVVLGFLRTAHVANSGVSSGRDSTRRGCRGPI